MSDYTVTVTEQPTTVTVNSPATTVTVPNETVAIVTAATQGPSGPGVAAGGTTGQVLKKNSSADFDTGWETLGTLATLNSIDLTANVGTTVLPVANGGSGTSTAFTAGSVLYAGASGVYSQDNANLFYDSTNKRLGIGDSSPAIQLTVGYSALIGSKNSTGYSSLYFNGSTGSARFAQITKNYNSPYDFNIYNSINTTDAPFNFYTDNGTTGARMTINTSGYVGIGTTSPGDKLEIASTSSSHTLGVVYSNSYNNLGFHTGNRGYAALFGYQYNNDTTNGVHYGTALTMNGFYDGTNWYTQNGYILPSTLLLQNGGFQFQTYNTSQGGTAGNYTPTSAMTILNSGNVGIGTTSPVGSLDVRSSTNTPSLSVHQPNASPYSTYWFNNTYSTSNPGGATLVDNSGNFFIGTPGSTNLGLMTGGATRLTVVSSGNVGIGTSSPTAHVHIQAGTATAGTAPIKLTAGTLLTTPESGTFEFDGMHLYFTIGSTRTTII